VNINYRFLLEEFWVHAAISYGSGCKTEFEDILRIGTYQHFTCYIFRIVANHSAQRDNFPSPLLQLCCVAAAALSAAAALRGAGGARRLKLEG
jgi:hypothetical protein